MYNIALPQINNNNIALPHVSHSSGICMPLLRQNSNSLPVNILFTHLCPQLLSVLHDSCLASHLRSRMLWCERS